MMRRKDCKLIHTLTGTSQSMIPYLMGDGVSLLCHENLEALASSLLSVVMAHKNLHPTVVGYGLVVVP